MVQLVLLACLANPLADPLVTISVPPTPLPNVLAAIGKLSGQPIAAFGPLRDQVVVVSVRQMPLSRLKTALASAVMGRWALAPDRKTLSLDRDPEGRRKRAVSGFNSTVAARLKNLGDSGPLTVEMAEASAREVMKTAGGDRTATFNAAGRAPIYRLLTRVLALVPPEDAGANLGKLTWSNFGVGKRFTSDVSGLLSTFKREQQIWSSAFAGMPNPAADPNSVANEVYAVSRPLPSEPRFVELDFSWTQERWRPIFFEVTDAHSKVLCRANSAYQPEEAGTLLTLPAFAALRDGAALSLDPSVLAFARSLRTDYLGGMNVDRGFPELAANPDEFLRRSLAQGFQAMASQYHLDVVAAVPDEATAWYEDIFRRPPVELASNLSGRLLLGRALSSGERVSQDGNLLLVEASPFIEPIDRHALVGFLQSVKDRTALPLPEWLQACRSFPGRQMTSACRLARWVDPEFLRPGIDLDLEVLRFLATLEPAQLRTLSAGGLAQAILSSQQMSLLRDIIAARLPSRPAGVQGRRDWQITDDLIARQPLTLQVKTVDCVFAESGAFLMVDDLARAQFWTDTGFHRLARNRQVGEGEDYADPVVGRLGSMDSAFLRCGVGSNAISVAIGPFYDQDRSRPLLHWSELPPGLVRQIVEAWKQKYRG